MYNQKFKFYFQDSDGNEYKWAEKVEDEEPDVIWNLLDHFKAFLKAMGYSPNSIARIQYIEDLNILKIIMEENDEWNEELEKWKEQMQSIS